MIPFRVCLGDPIRMPHSYPRPIRTTEHRYLGGTSLAHFAQRPGLRLRYVTWALPSVIPVPRTKPSRRVNPVEGRSVESRDPSAKFK
jgi:hypothetical protein